MSLEGFKSTELARRPARELGYSTRQVVNSGKLLARRAVIWATGQGSRAVPDRPAALRRPGRDALPGKTFT